MKPRKIFKYPLEITDIQRVSMPKAAQILSVHEQNGHICLWAMVDTEAEKEDRLIEIVGTGNPFTSYSANPKFVGTVLLYGGSLGFHVFDATN